MLIKDKISNSIIHHFILDYDYFFKLTDAFLSEDIPASLLLFDTIFDKGFDGQHFLLGLSKHFRDLLVAQDEKTANLLEVGANIKQQYIEQAKKAADDGQQLKSSEINYQV